MRRMFILGGGGFGREIAGLLHSLPDCGREWEMAGFLDKRPAASDIPLEYPIVGDEDSLEFRSDDLVILAVAAPGVKMALYEKLQNRVQFYTFIHPSCIVFPSATVGAGSVLYPNCIISANAALGRAVTVNAGSQLGHDCAVGDYCSLMAHVDLGGGARLGNGCFAGTKATVVPGKSIADNTKIAVGSVVMRSFKSPGVTLFGNPAVEL